ncbi:S-layer homology domain-containing protein [Ammoniphilus sp. CFH 90114]|uniref:S-layer homology domain-containing protein n=1 Tax=Ammoniphilus sp. CFH 90114 TaxID=2493665 RepID=UPI00100FE472|nr:S-layer homology domain-containing protein [Ammoniphilus sp. CFH 90114]RXT03718.1 hypothetical protein EIZ39_22985 [Ammoniphilus sp. CFH 90114]
MIKKLLALSLTAVLLSSPVGGNIYAAPTETNQQLHPITKQPIYELSSMDYQGMIKTLEEFEEKSNGKLEVFTLSERGYQHSKSQQGRELYVAKIGNGDKKIWIQGRIHGDEPYGLESQIEILERLIEQKDEKYKTLMNELTMYFIPMYNPDGSEMNNRRTFLFDPKTGEPVLDEKGEQKSVDMNRDWAENMFLASDSIAFYEFWADIKPDFAFDIHHQGLKTLYGTEDKQVTMSLGISLAPGGPTLPGVQDGKYDEVTRQALVHVYDELLKYDQFVVDRYTVGNGTQEIDIKGGVVSGMMLGLNYKGLNPDGHSNPAIFIETSGNTRQGDMPEDQREDLILQNVVALDTFLTGIASGDIYKEDASRWSEIPHAPIEGYQTDYDGIMPIIPVKGKTDEKIVLDKPNNTITRYQAAELLVKALNLPVSSNNAVFKDVPKGHESEIVVGAVHAAGIFTGKSDGTFGSNDELTRAQLAVILEQAFDLSASTGSVPSFEDVPTSWASQSIGAVASLDILNGKDGKFRPNEAATRGEFGTALVKAINQTKMN